MMAVGAISNTNTDLQNRVSECSGSKKWSRESIWLTVDAMYEPLGLGRESLHLRAIHQRRITSKV